MFFKKIIALIVIALIGVCIPIVTTLINNDLVSKTKKNSSSKSQEFVDFLRTSCNQDVKDYTVYGVTYFDSRLEQVIIMCCFQMETLFLVILIMKGKGDYVYEKNK